MSMRKSLILLTLIITVFSLTLSLYAQEDDDEPVKLTEDFTVDLITGETVIFSYPDEWVGEFILVSWSEQYVSYAISLTNNPELFISTDPEYASGDISVNLFTYPFALSQTILASNNLIELTNIYGFSDLGEFELEFAQLRNREIAVGDYTTEFDHRRYGLLLDNIFIFVEFTTPIGELQQHTALMNAIIGSIDVVTMQN